MKLLKRADYNWNSTGPGGCDSHCIEHPCGRCAQAAGRKFEPPELGTPKTLREAIRRALLIGPLSGAEERTYLAVKDFIAQRIGAAVLLQSSMAESALMKVFEDIVEDPKPEAKSEKV